MTVVSLTELWVYVIVAAVFGFAAGAAVAYIALRRPWWLGDDWTHLARTARRRQ